MNRDYATEFVTTNKGATIVLDLSDGTAVTGEALSVNSKGVNVKIDGKTKSVALSRIDFIGFPKVDDEDELDENDEMSADAEIEDAELEGADHTNEEIYAMLSEGMTTAELAAVLSEALDSDLTPKELRVHLRALGLGVGKGRKYSLSATEFRMVRDLVKANA